MALFRAFEYSRIFCCTNLYYQYDYMIKIKSSTVKTLNSCPLNKGQPLNKDQMTTMQAYYF